MRIAYKVWLDNNGKAFGEGPYQLLMNVEKTGSLRKGAEKMGMSYSKAWRLMRNIEKRLNFPLLKRHIGGSSGGGSILTPDALKLLWKYERFAEDVKKALEKVYKRHFGLME